MSIQSIDPYWAHWFVGLCDGEASFTYRNTTMQDMPARPRFKLTLQGDDDIVQEVNEALFDGGYVRINERVASKRPSGKDYKNRSDLDITDKRRLLLVVEFFERFPLRSHKRQDFLLWRELVFHYCYPKNPPVPERIREIVAAMITDRDSGMSRRGQQRLLGKKNTEQGADGNRP